ncbi:hypothetical protein PUR30_00690, partial [Streptomyces sp. JV190]|nr:hypothetical protein [Streptomyces sp. JV190]
MRRHGLLCPEVIRGLFGASEGGAARRPSGLPAAGPTTPPPPPPPPPPPHTNHPPTNPRATNHTDPSRLAATHPARLHPDWVLPYGGKLYCNPGIPEVRRFVQDAMLDAVR